MIEELVRRIAGLQARVTRLETHGTPRKDIIAVYQALPALRGFWPMSASTSLARDLGGGGFHLTAGGTPLFGYDGLAPYVQYNGATGYHYYADDAQFDILGTEGNVVAAQRGLTLGCWVKPSALTTDRGLICKFSTANDRAYYLRITSDKASILVSADGAAATGGSSTSSVDIDAWSFVVGRWIPSTTADVWLNSEHTSAANGVASLFNSTANFYLGTRNGAAQFYAGDMSMAFVCACALSDSIITAIWNQTRAMYGR